MTRVAAKEHNWGSKEYCCGTKLLRSIKANHTAAGGGSQQLSILLGSGYNNYTSGAALLGPVLLRQATVKDAVVP